MIHPFQRQEFVAATRELTELRSSWSSIQEVSMEASSGTSRGLAAGPQG